MNQQDKDPLSPPSHFREPDIQFQKDFSQYNNATQRSAVDPSSIQAGIAG